MHMLTCYMQDQGHEQALCPRTAYPHWGLSQPIQPFPKNETKVGDLAPIWGFEPLKSDPEHNYKPFPLSVHAIIFFKAERKAKWWSFFVLNGAKPNYFSALQNPINKRSTLVARWIPPSCRPSNWPTLHGCNCKDLEMLFLLLGANRNRKSHLVFFRGRMQTIQLNSFYFLL